MKKQKKLCNFNKTNSKTFVIKIKQTVNLLKNSESYVKLN